MVATLKNNISLYKELQVAQKSPEGINMIYTCYEAIPNGGFCILSAIPDEEGNIQLKRASYSKEPLSVIESLNIEFFPTLIEAINAYTLTQSNNAS